MNGHEITTTAASLARFDLCRRWAATQGLDARTQANWTSGVSDRAGGPHGLHTGEKAINPLPTQQNERVVDPMRLAQDVEASHGEALPSTGVQASLERERNV